MEMDMYMFGTQRQRRPESTRIVSMAVFEARWRLNSPDKHFLKDVCVRQNW